MLTAHLPSGYLFGRLVEKNRPNRQIMIAALIGAVIPDLDMLYFHFVDFGRTHHHLFVSHWPLAWIAIGLPAITLLHVTGQTFSRNLAMAFFGAVILHLCLDSIAAPIFWLMPLTQGKVELVSVPASYSHWILSYLLHWTFTLELAIWLAATLLHIKSKKTTLS